MTKAELDAMFSRLSRPVKQETTFRNKETIKDFITTLLSYGFTRAEIASACDVNRLTICAWEVGEMLPNNKNAETLESLYRGLLGNVEAR